jgi:two-component system NtrC family sensor kinase
LLERAARPVFDSVGRKLGRVEVYRDLTAQRLFQSQLLQTEKLAALGQMVSGVAHELSNPLTSILGYAQRMLLRADAAGKAPEVRQIFHEAERAAGIVRQLLFSAREAPPERRRVALNRVVLRSMELQRFSMATEKIGLELDLDPGLPVVLGDAAQLQQVLMNLVGNARQAIEQKGAGGRIRVRTLQVAERRVQLEVQDDGPGVPQSILARIFDPFFTTKAEGVGTGLGLSIVLSIVREHGGSVHVQNAPNGGALFTVELPVAEGVSLTPPWPTGSFQRALHMGSAVGAFATASNDAASLDLEANSSATGVSPSSSVPLRGRVLVVEDEPTVARLIADVLQDEGLDVEVLLDGREGLKRIAERRFDLVICDMRMPGLDGQQFYRQLAKSGSTLQHSFLFVTGDVIAPATQAFLEQNRLPHLAKPFRVEELTERVRQVLQPSAVGAARGGGGSRNTARKSATSKP